VPRWPLALALLVPAALAQRAPGGADPVARYHEGAQAYVDGEMAEARAAVQAGLRADPDNARLQALRDLIEQDREEQDQRQGGRQDPDGENPEQDEQPQGDPGDGQDGEREDGGPEAEADQTQTGPQDPGDGQGGQRPGQGEATPPGGPVPEGQMSRAQAERILEAVGGDERLLLRELRRAPTRARRADKDW
jgi:Ca-activated chloride channel family protein